LEETLTLVEKTAFLKSIESLASIPTEALADLASRAREIHHDAGDTIFREGEPNRGTYLVIEGSVVLRIGGAAVRVVRAGMPFGELFLGRGEPHNMTAVAIEHTHVLNVTSDDIFDAMGDYPDFAASIVRSMSRQLLALNSRVVELEGILSRFHTALVKAGVEPPEKESDASGAKGAGP
jgi:CRP-like cAMP-binding protein